MVYKPSITNLGAPPCIHRSASSPSDGLLSPLGSLGLPGHTDQWDAAVAIAAATVHHHKGTSKREILTVMELLMVIDGY